MKTLRQSAEARRDSRALRPSAYRISYPESAQPPSAPPKNQPQSSAPAGHGATDIVELIRAACGDGSRRALRIASLDATGSIFFDGGHIVHAEFGEDYGLRALAPMLRAGPFVVEPWSGKWPSQPSFHLSAELLLSMVGRDGPNAYQLDTRVIRKVDHHAVTPPPLPDPSELDFDAFALAAEGQEPAKASLSTRLAATLPAPPLLPPPSSIPSSIPPSIPPRNTLVRAKPSRTLPTAVEPAPAAVGAAASARAAAGESSSMVRVSARGALLAAHGRHADRLADAAAFIHGLANSIAVDLGGQGRAAIHLRDRSRSLFVARSEVGDVAAAFGRTSRLASVLRKVGLR